jgi:hypothetical protein
MAKIMNKMTEDQKASLGIPELGLFNNNLKKWLNFIKNLMNILPIKN